MIYGIVLNRRVFDAVEGTTLSRQRLVDKAALPGGLLQFGRPNKTWPSGEVYLARWGVFAL